MKKLNYSYHYWELRSKHIWLAIKNVGDKTTIKYFSDVIITDDQKSELNSYLYIFSRLNMFIWIYIVLNCFTHGLCAVLGEPGG